MTVSLEQVWTAPLTSLEPILASKGFTPSGNANRDRAIVATIYYNSGNLAKEDQWLVEWPDFINEMARIYDEDNTIGYNESVARLQYPLTDEMLKLYILLHAGSTNEESEHLYPLFAGLLDNSLEEKDLMSLHESYPGHEEGDWKAIIDDREEYYKLVDDTSHEGIRDTNSVMAKLLAFDTSTMDPALRCYYKYKVGQLLKYFPHTAAYADQWRKSLVEQVQGLEYNPNTGIWSKVATTHSCIDALYTTQLDGTLAAADENTVIANLFP